jgi:hypothetical protein
MAVADEYGDAAAATMPRPQVAAPMQQQSYAPYYANHAGQLDFAAYGYAAAPDASLYAAGGVSAATAPVSSPPFSPFSCPSLLSLMGGIRRIFEPSFHELDRWSGVG